MRLIYRVTLKGDWERPITSLFEVKSFKQQILREAEREGLDVELRPRGPSDTSMRRGSFVVVFPEILTRDGRRAITRASQRLRELLADVTCRPPTITVDRDASSARYIR